jgi:hypothetical protein
LFDEGTEDKAADAAESVDGDGGHCSILKYRCGSSARRRDYSREFRGVNLPNGNLENSALPQFLTGNRIE